MSLITLTTDFGIKDPFVAMMKGVIYSINNDVSIIDISHGIENHDVSDGSFIISHTFNYFPEDTIHVVVVDPEVGSNRRPIIARASDHYFIGPDNGVLSLVIAGDQSASVYEITAERYFLRSAGNTFHGRDIFAPVAGWLSKGGEPQIFGNIVTDYVCLDIHKPYKDDGILKGEIIYIDKFGNLFTNISRSDIEEYRQNRQDSSMMIRFRGKEITGIKSYYSEARTLEFAGIINSFGLLEIYSYTGNAAKLSNANKGDAVSLYFKGFSNGR
jgi:S-adenosylmethionine hydrolase